MQAYWITFEDGSTGCCEGQSAYDAKYIATKLTGKKVKDDGDKYGPTGAEVLPYPAKPLIWQFEHPVHGKTPDFCWKPEQCKGKSSCPRNPCCTS